MKQMKRLIVASIRSTACNMRCSYCYIGGVGAKKPIPAKFEYSVDHMAKAFTRSRLGGTCLIHFVSGGETLLPEESVEFTRRMLEEGHFVYLVTNMVLTERLRELLALPKDLLKRLIFHPSFHFLELKRLNKLDEYFSNIRGALRAGCSCAPSMVLNEDYVPYIREIEKLWMQKMGGLPQATPVRNVERPELAVDFQRIDEFVQKGAFNSVAYQITKRVENVKRTEFCYAGDWALMVNLLNGEASKCIRSRCVQNVFKDLSRPILFEAQGNCEAPWCMCGATFLSFGMIPDLNLPTVAESRGRKEWLNDEARAFLSSKLYDSNEEYGQFRKWWVASGRGKVQRLQTKIRRLPLRAARLLES